MIKKIKILIIVSCILQLKTAAQDLHFSQFFNSPLVTNPANTGFIPDADYRIGANYRNQWSSVMSVPYKTVSAFAFEIYSYRISYRITLDEIKILRLRHVRMRPKMF